MKNTLVVLAIALTLTSCVEVLFEHPQPTGAKALKEFPKKLVGMYTEVDDKDTLIVSSTKLYDPNDKNDSTMQLSSDLILKKFRGYYVVSSKHDSGLWEVGFIDVQKDGSLRIFTIDGDDEAKMNTVKQLVDVKTNYDEDGKVGQYILNPTKKELKELLELAIFEEIGVFERIEN